MGDAAAGAGAAAVVERVLASARHKVAPSCIAAVASANSIAAMAAICSAAFK